METITKTKIRNFTDLDAWQKGHMLVIAIYKATSSFPRSEEFGLASQMRRAAVSITSNLAEAFSRNSRNEKVQFYSIAGGSLTELQNQLLVARDVGFLSPSKCTELLSQTVAVHKLTNGLVKSAKSRQENSL